MSVDVSAILAAHGAEVDDALARWVGACPATPPGLAEAITYSVSAGGKRLRPALVLETYAATHAIESDADRRSALAAAVAMELIHTFSLVHDDLPAMDDDDFRRGKPTNHKVYGEAVAILAGDAMTTLAFEVLAVHADAGLVAPLVSELAHAAGPAGMIGGQALDLAGEGRSLTLEQLKQIHAMKTGALLAASCRLGAICGRCEDSVRSAAAEFGRNLGLAFQIVDDILDETSTPEQLGKATQKDRERGKNTYPKLLGLDGARRAATAATAAAREALLPLGERAQRLCALLDFVIDRTK